MFTFFINFSVLNILSFLIVQKNLEGQYDRIHRLMILWTEVFEFATTRFRKLGSLDG
jgi:hypothetical protein